MEREVSPSSVVREGGGLALRVLGKDRRKKTRPRRRVAVRYGPREARHFGYTSEYDEKGLFLQGKTLYPPDTVLQILIEMPGGVTRALRGRVCWIKDVPEAFRRTLRGGMGIELIEE
jgi:hypothetical protein